MTTPAPAQPPGPAQRAAEALLLSTDAITCGNDGWFDVDKVSAIITREYQPTLDALKAAREALEHFQFISPNESVHRRKADEALKKINALNP